MKNPLLLSITGITLVALTATTLYAQTTTGNSVISKMKVAVSAFTLAGDLNPGQTGLQSAPVSGKKTGDILTAGEWNRVLELVSEGGSGAGWVNVPLDTAEFDKSCEYRFQTITPTNTVDDPYMGNDPYHYVNAVDNDRLTWFILPGSYHHINFDSKTIYRVNGVPNTDATISKIEKRCGGGGGANASTTSNLTYYINPDNTDFTPLECTPGMNYMINPISFSAESASTYTSKKVAVLKSGNWRLKGTSFDGVRNKNSDSSQTLRINSIIDGVTTQLLNSTVDVGMYIYSLPATSTNYETVSVPAGKTAQIDVSLRNINLRGGQLMAWCTN